MDKIKIINKVKAKLTENKITWVKPKFIKEICSYFEKPETIKTLKDHNILFSDEKEILSYLNKGHFGRISDEELQEKGKNINVDLEDFDKEVATNQNLSLSYKHLEKSLIEKDLNLESPILFKFLDGTYWGFSGNRRANLARKNNIPVLFWIIDQEKISKQDKEKEEKNKNEEILAETWF